MEKTKPLIEYEVSCDAFGGMPVIVVAGGSSTRMGQNKLLMNIGGLPVLVRTLKVFQQCDKIGSIILVASAQNVLEYQTLCEKFMLTKVTDIVAGGDNRQASVLNGINRLNKKDKKVLIHDGARPLVSEKIINDIINGLNNFNAVVPVVRVKDTIKKVDKNGLVIKTVNREDLVQVQTPQGVEVSKYLNAMEGKDLSSFTDDVSIFEAVGDSVLAVDGDYKNIKITTPEDILVAEAFLREETVE